MLSYFPWTNTHVERNDNFFLLFFDEFPAAAKNREKKLLPMSTPASVNLKI